MVDPTDTGENKEDINNVHHAALSPVPESAKEQILETFRRLLEKAFETSQAPDGIAPQIWKELAAGYPESAQSDGQTDLFQMWSVLTVLSQEIKIQGRTFNKLAEGVESLLSKLAVLSEHEQSDYQKMTTQLQGIADEILKLRQQQFQEARAVKQQAARMFVDALIEMRERMLRGAESAGAALSDTAAALRQPIWFFRKRRQDTRKRHFERYKTLVEGYMINLDRLEDLFKQYEIVDIHCADKMFDPLLMKAVALDDNPALPEGTVTEVFSRGYLFGGQVYRPAEVKVVRHLNPPTLPE